MSSLKLHREGEAIPVLAFSPSPYLWVFVYFRNIVISAVKCKKPDDCLSALSLPEEGCPLHWNKISAHIFNWIPIPLSIITLPVVQYIKSVMKLRICVCVKPPIQPSSRMVKNHIHIEIRTGFDPRWWRNSNNLKCNSGWLRLKP